MAKAPRPYLPTAAMWKTRLLALLTLIPESCTVCVHLFGELTLGRGAGCGCPHRFDLPPSFTLSADFSVGLQTWSNGEEDVDRRVKVALKLVQEQKALVQFGLTETSKILGLSEPYLLRLF